MKKQAFIDGMTAITAKDATDDETLRTIDVLTA